MSTSTNDNNEDELVAPNWLNNEFIEKILRHCEKLEAIKLKSFELKPAAGKGDHFASIIFRATVVYCINSDVKKRSLIIKTMPVSEGFKKEMLQDMRIFETEIGMYTEIIPKFEAMLKAAGDDTKLGGNCLYHTLSPAKVIVFEDIVPLGYDLIRGRQTNLEETKAALSKLAKWHAVSYKLGKEEPHLFDAYNYSLFNQKSVTESECFRDGITNFIELLDSYEDLKPYKPYFEPLAKTLVDKCIESFDEARKNPQTNALYGLCHGDFHHSNLMFKHDQDTQKLSDVMLLDFQLSYFGSLVNDVIYAIYQLLDENLRANNLDEILFYYFNTFQETLRKIGYKGDIPKMVTFKAELMRQKYLDIFLVTTFLPMASAIFDENTENFATEEILSNAEMRKNLFYQAKYLKEVRRLLPKFLYMGYLEN